VVLRIAYHVCVFFAEIQKLQQIVSHFREIADSIADEVEKAKMKVSTYKNKYNVRSREMKTKL